MFFGPRNVARQDRLVILDFTFECGLHSEWTDSYLLTVRGTHEETRPRRAVPTAQPPAFTPAPAPTTPAPPDGETPDCGDLAVTVEADQAEVTQGSLAAFTIRVTNVGMASAIKPEIRLSLPVGLWERHWTTSQGYAGYDGVYRRWVYSPGTLAAGSTAEARGAGTALFGGALKLSAQPVIPDCDPENDQAEAWVNVTVPPRPDLAANREKMDIGWTRHGFPLRRLLTGTLRVTNQGQVDAGPTRVLILDTWTSSGHIHNARALGWVVVPALPAGAGAVVPISLPYDAPQSHVRVVALLDSESSEYESNERNNLVGVPGWW